MLLLTAVTFGGADAAASFDALPDEDAELLKHRADALMQIPRDKRIPLLVQEIKRLITVRRKQLQLAEAGRLAEVLKGERAATVEVVLRALPVQLAEAVRNALPELKPVRLKREVKPDVLSIVRWKLEDALLRALAKGAPSFRFVEILNLQPRELMTVCDRMGARSLATSFAGLNDADREALFARLPPDQRSLAQRAADAGKSRHLSEEDSKVVLDMHGANEDPSTGMRSAGAQRVMRAAIAQSLEVASRLVERHPPELAKLLQKWFKEERSKPVRGDGGRADIVEQLERLAQRGVVDRPMRMPPPKLPPPPMVSGSHPLPGGKLVVPPPRLQDKRPPVLGPPPGRGPDGGKSGLLPQLEPRSGLVPSLTPRQPADPIAQREARKAGAKSSALQEAFNRNRANEPKRKEPLPGDPRVKVTTDPNIKAARIMRDGKKLEGATGPRRAMTSPALVDIPRRREKPREPSAKVLKGGPSRGPKGGSG